MIELLLQSGYRGPMPRENWSAFWAALQEFAKCRGQSYSREGDAKIECARAGLLDPLIGTVAAHCAAEMAGN